jgi:LmbE family N-acetylglucosaminyl deacetylase
MAHPDDLEFYISNFLITVAKNPKNTVKMISMTRGDQGTVDPKLKGEKLARIRTQELRRAAKIEGVTDVEFLGFGDSNVRVTHSSIQTVKSAIDVFAPDIIFAPECLYPYYPHKDHVKTGWIIYKIIKAMAETAHPRLFFYHSYVNTHYFPMIHWRQQSKAIREHISQYWLLIPLYHIRFILGSYFRLYLPHRLRYSWFSEAFREVKFQDDLSRNYTLMQRLLERFVALIKPFLRPIEQEK